MNRLTFILLLILSVADNCRAQRTTRRSLRPIAAAVSDTTAGGDTIFRPGADMVTLSGYDKPLRSATETLFATNHSSRTIHSVTIHIVYRDMSGRQLHSRDATVAVTIPPGETRQLQFPSWDKQKSFVYHRSRRPPRAEYAPYDITATVAEIATSSGQTPIQSDSIQTSNATPY